MTPSPPAEVAAAFAAVPERQRALLLAARGRIFQVAARLGVGPLTETLKWGQPAYLTSATRQGSTLRLGLAGGGRAAVFFICTTRLVDGFRRDFPDAFAYEGDRALVLRESGDGAALDICLARGLAYHRDRKAGRR